MILLLYQSTVLLQIDAALKQSPPLNSSRTILEFLANKCRPRIVAMGTIRGTRTHMQVISDNDHRSSARAVCVV